MQAALSWTAPRLRLASGALAATLLLHLVLLAWLQSWQRQPAAADQSHGLPGTSPAASDEQRLAQRIGAAGHGDCSKREYAGAGFGLLSLPFLAAAVLREDCGR